MKTLIADIMKNAALARDGKISNAELYRAADRPAGRHEFLFFIKPEIFEPGAPVKTEAVLEQRDPLPMPVLSVTREVQVG